MWGKVPKVRLAVEVVFGFGMFSWVSQSGVHPEGGYAEIISQCRHPKDGWGKQRQRLASYYWTLEISISKRI